jgi:hypothetical protein
MVIMVRHMMPDLLGEAEKGGHFRRLIPLSAVDTTRTGYKRDMVHPQWIIYKGPQQGAGSDGES